MDKGIRRRQEGEDGQRNLKHCLERYSKMPTRLLVLLDAVCVLWGSVRLNCAAGAH